MQTINVRPEHGPGWRIATGTYNYWLYAPRPETADHAQRKQWLAMWDKVDASDANMGEADSLEDVFLAANWPVNFKGARQARRELTAAAELFLTTGVGA